MSKLYLVIDHFLKTTNWAIILRGNKIYSSFTWNTAVTSESFEYQKSCYKNNCQKQNSVTNANCSLPGIRESKPYSTLICNLAVLGNAVQKEILFWARVETWETLCTAILQDFLNSCLIVRHLCDQWGITKYHHLWKNFPFNFQGFSFCRSAKD